MIIARLESMQHGLRSSLNARPMEWAFALILTTFGWTLLLDADTFVASRSFSALAEWMSEDTWGWVCFLGGLLRLTILWVNGAWRRSPHLRATMAFLSCGVWFLLAWGLLSSGTTPTGVGTYFWILAFDAYNVLRAARDAGVVDTRIKGSGHGTRA